MNKIFTGLIMLLVKIDLNLVGVPITIFPDFVAYIFIYFGLSELSAVAPMFRKSLKPALFLIFYSLAWDLIMLVPQVTYNGFALTEICKLVSGLTMVYVLYIVIVGLREYQRKNNAEIDTRELKRRWRGVVIMSLASPLFRTLTNNDAFILYNFKYGYVDASLYYASLVYIVIAAVFGIVYWCVMVYFTAEFNRVREAYNMSRIPKF